MSLTSSDALLTETHSTETFIAWHESNSSVEHMECPFDFILIQ